MKCSNPLCSEGWVFIQHPLKPPGVIMSNFACPVCNKDKKVPNPFENNYRVEVKVTGNERETTN